MSQPDSSFCWLTQFLEMMFSPIFLVIHQRTGISGPSRYTAGVNFVRSGLFPTGHVSLTWEHRVFVPSAEGSPEKRRACHTHHWNLLSLWPNTAGHLRVTPHPFAYRAHSASPQPRRRHPTRPTSVSQTTMHGQPHPSQAKFRAASYLVHHQLRRPCFRSDRALGLNPCLPPACPHGR